MRGRLHGRGIFITGASSGVGRATARLFGEHGARVALAARNVKALENAANEVRLAGGEALIVPLDVSDDDAVQRAADRVAHRWGGIDVWVNNAMISVFSPVWKTTADEYRRVTQVTYLGYVHGTLAALRHMMPRREGVIVQVGSALAYRSIPLQSAYCAAKAAIRGFTDSLRSELIHEGLEGIRLSMVHLPALNTPQFEVVRTRLPRHPQPVPPIYQPEVAARAIVNAAIRPRREVWVGTSVVKAIVGQRIIPGWLDRYLANHAWDEQQTDEPLYGVRDDNLWQPPTEDLGAHGIFDGESASYSPQSWLSRHRKLVAGAALASMAVAAGVGLTRG